MRYEFPNVKFLKKLKLDVEYIDNRLAVKAKGPFAPLYQRLFSLFFNVYNSVGPVGTSDGAGIYTLYVPPIPSPMHNRHTENFVRRWLYGIRLPLAVTIAVTDKCQLKCGHCSVTQSSPPQPPLSTEELQSVVRQCVDLGTTNVTFTGGEPLLRRDLERVIEAVPQDKAVSLVFTNGIGLTPARARRLKAAGLWGVQVSLDSPDTEEHDRLRGRKGCFDGVRKGIKAARDAGLFVGLSTYATNDSARKRSLERMAELSAAWGAHELTAFDAIPTGRLQNQAEVLLTPAGRKLLLRNAAALRKKYHAKIHVVTQSWTNSRSGFARFIGCLAGHYQFHIAAGGDLRPCDFTPLAIGNVRRESVADLWHKLTIHPGYHKHSHTCRMQDPSFRKKYIDPADDQPAQKINRPQ